MGHFSSDFSLFCLLLFRYPLHCQMGLLGSNPSHALLIFFVLNFFLPGPVERLSPFFLVRAITHFDLRFARTCSQMG